MSLMDKILTLNTTRPTESELAEPRTYRRRATWIPVAGESVTVWRMASFDPDVQEALAGVFVTSTDDSYTVLIERETSAEVFHKKDSHGATLWFLDHRGHELEMKK
jgi:hypothetical protein